MKTSKRSLGLLALCAVTLLCGGLVAAEANNNPDTMKIRKTMKAVSGEVAGLDSGFITLIYKKSKTTEFEIVLPLHPELQFEHLKGLQDIRSGDMVQIKYEELTERPGEPGERTYLTAKVISLVKHVLPSARRSLEAPSDE